MANAGIVVALGSYTTIRDTTAFALRDGLGLPSLDGPSLGSNRVKAVAIERFGSRRPAGSAPLAASPFRLRDFALAKTAGCFSFDAC